MNDQAPYGIDQVVALLDELPHTLVPAYVSEQPNSSIPLYTGDIAVSFGDVSYACQGSVGLEWHPSPHIRFDAVLPASEGFASLSAKQGTLCITLSGINATAEGIVTRHSYGQQASLTGTLHGRGIVSGDGSI